MQLSYFIYDLDEEDWCFIGEKDEFKHFLPIRPNLKLKSKKFIIFQNEKLSGPFSIEEIEQLIAENKVSPFDFFCAKDGEDWIRLFDSTIFQDFFSAPPLKRPLLLKPILLEEREEKRGGEESVQEGPHAPLLKDGDKKGCREIHNDPVWLVKRGGEELGPFRYMEVVKMIQKNIINRSHEIKRVSESQWKNIYDVLEFNGQYIKKVIAEGGEKFEKIIMKRRHKRSSFLAPVRIKYKEKNYRGTCSSISLGGCFIEMRPEGLEIGQNIILEVLPGALPIKFFTQGKIVSISEKTPKGISIKFVGLDAEDAKKIEKFIEKIK